MILVIDNYDSFTYNLVQYLGELGVEFQHPHIQGVQFHPESILTLSGKKLLRNFLIPLNNS